MDYKLDKTITQSCTRTHIHTPVAFIASCAMPMPASAAADGRTAESCGVFTPNTNCGDDREPDSMRYAHAVTAGPGVSKRDFGLGNLPPASQWQPNAVQ